jgi:hypothetical protein
MANGIWGADSDGANGIAVDAAGNVYVTGAYVGVDSLRQDYTTIKYSQPVGINTISNEIPKRIFNISKLLIHSIQHKNRFSLVPLQGRGTIC